MLTVNHPSELASRGAFVLAIGTFDGMHRGHQAVFDALKSAAQKHHTHTAALFFSPMPREILCKSNPPKHITSDSEKLALLEQIGIDAAICVKFDTALASLSPEEFLAQYIFCPQVKIKTICVGSNWHFGRNNCGDTALLRNLASAHGIDLVAIPEVIADGAPISSTRIRTLVAEGKLAEAEALLGHHYAISGKVCAGNGIAKGTLQCPTANLVDDAKQLPPYGVYAARTYCDGIASALPGIVYIGNAPTFRSDGHPIVEVHLFDFNRDIYNRNITVEPVQFLRPSIRFDSPDALKKQIAQDIANAYRALQLTPPLQ